MTRAEIYKLRTHRTPWVCAATLLLGVLTPSIVLIWYTPTDPAAYTTNFTDTYDALSVLLGIVFGGWLLGSEYRQGTVKRLLTSEPRRIRALATKGGVGAAAMATVLAVVGGVGWTAARIVGSMNEITVAWQGKAMLIAALWGLALATVAYGLSCITRSDAFAMVGTVAMVFILEPLLSVVPRLGDYTLVNALGRVLSAISAEETLEPSALSMGAAAITLTVWLGGLLGVGAVAFARRDV